MRNVQGSLKPESGTGYLFVFKSFSRIGAGGSQYVKGYRKQGNGKCNKQGKDKYSGFRLNMIPEILEPFPKQIPGNRQSQEVGDKDPFRKLFGKEQEYVRGIGSYHFPERNFTGPLLCEE
jgi:hypothetical protein